MVAIHACPRNRNASERLWPESYWAKLIDMLPECIYIGTEEDRQYYERINRLSLRDASTAILGKVPLSQIGNILLCCSYLVCVNSSIMHIAVYTNTPLVAIVGGTPARIILPKRDNIKVLEDPGLMDWDEDGEFKPRVSRLHEITPEMVMEKIGELG